MSELLEKVDALLEELKNYGISGDQRLSDWRWRAAAELPRVADELRQALLQLSEVKRLFAEWGRMELSDQQFASRVSVVFVDKPKSHVAGAASQAGPPLGPGAPVAVDTCGNYRDAGGLRSVFCSGFEPPSRVHSPGCQFAEKRNDESPLCQHQFSLGQYCLLKKGHAGQCH